MIITKGLYEVIVSPSLTLDQKKESIRLFTLPIYHLDGDTRYVESPVLIEEDAELLIEALEQLPPQLTNIVRIE